MYVSGVPSFGRSRRRSRQTRERAINASGGQEVYLYLVACQYEILCIRIPPLVTRPSAPSSRSDAERRPANH